MPTLALAFLHCALRLAFPVFSMFVLTLVVLLLALGEADFQLDPAA
jgi:hypothetical protein